MGLSLDKFGAVGAYIFLAAFVAGFILISQENPVTSFKKSD